VSNEEMLVRTQNPQEDIDKAQQVDEVIQLENRKCIR
jgi:hypothetical protein